MAGLYSSAQPARDAVTAAVALMAMIALCGNASAAFYINCAGCHTVPQNGVNIVNYQTTTNLGAGLLKVFEVNPGQTAVIQLNVTNSYGGEYGLNINNLDAGGVVNGSDHMTYTADPTWTSYFPGTTTNFFMAGCATTSPDLWTFNLVVKTNTPTDFYTVKAQMAGYDSASSMWSQQESFYVRVVSTVPSLSISSSSTNVIVSWPAIGSYILQQNSNMAGPAGWATSGYPVITNMVTGTNSITITPPTGCLFFRLANP
ncbi:MAG: hypothetical protein ABSA83_23850 [Verrucomicrobiota bacterium]|jgi:hypothetical protein